MSSRYTRPRTRVYDSNYNLGESYYRSALDRLDRKYGGGGMAASPPPMSHLRNTSAQRDLTEQALSDEDLATARRRAEKHITERHLFDSRGGRIDPCTENGIEDDIVYQLKKLRAAKKVSMIDDVDLQNTMDNLSAKRLFERGEKMLQSVGLGETEETANESNVMRRTMQQHQRTKMQIIADGGVRNGENMVHWQPLHDQGADVETSGAQHRARRTRERLANLEGEMQELAEKQAARERRTARLKAFVAENVAGDSGDVAAETMTGTLKRRHRKVFSED